jgi:hypothetical protein
MRKQMVKALLSLVVLVATTSLVDGQSTPLLDQGYAGMAMVSGKVSPGQESVTVYDTSYSARMVLGRSKSMDGSGNFAASINPPLVLGHHIVVVDQSGASSPAMTVAPRPSSPSHR